ncbi:MAG: nicotinamide riboside transporter PnuC [Clostridia bacterium]|nr:nicotinamide riboside transporter PnuC [Clostridia bacterium]
MSMPFSNFTKNDWILLKSSLLIVLASNIVSPQFDVLITIAALIGVTSLVLGAKGNVWSPLLMVVFSVLYGIISYRFCYWGELVTYLGMTLPMSAWAAVEWFRNPSEKKGEVAISPMNRTKWLMVLLSTILVTIGFYFILKHFDTPNLIFSTLSITTSFFAASLTLLRSSYYPLFYSANDVILIILWILATLENPVYFPVIINFVVFFVNDFYGFISWRKREKLGSRVT